MNKFVAIDPMALVLSHEVYVRLHLPDPAPDEVLTKAVRESIAHLNEEGRHKALASAISLGRLAGIIQNELRASR
jgi:hypothetical protein